MSRDHAADPRFNDHLTSRDTFAHIACIVVTKVLPGEVHSTAYHRDPWDQPRALCHTRAEWAAMASRMDLLDRAQVSA